MEKKSRFNFRKLFALLATAFVFFFAVSQTIPIIEAGHHCENHDDCLICEVIRTQEENSKKEIITPNKTFEVKTETKFVFVKETTCNSYDLFVETPITLNNKISS